MSSKASKEIVQKAKEEVKRSKQSLNSKSSVQCWTKFRTLLMQIDEEAIRLELEAEVLENEAHEPDSLQQKLKDLKMKKLFSR